MNVRKPVDYSAMFAALDMLMAADLPQMELYYEIGRLVSGRTEKGAAVAAAEYLCSTYPDVSGFSPRNLRRMREFYRTYETNPEVLAEAITVGWTQNVVILEAELTLPERAWYIQKAQQLGWSKLTLLEKIKSGAHNEIVLDFRDEVCYTGDHDTEMEHKSDDEDTFYLPRQYLSEPNSRIRDEGSGEESGIGEPIPYRVRRHQCRGDWKSSLSSGLPQAGRAWYRLHWQNGPPTEERGLQSVRPPDWDESEQSAEYVTDMQRRLRWQNAFTDGVCWLSDAPVAGPWYTGNPEDTWQDVSVGYKGLLVPFTNEAE